MAAAVAGTPTSAMPAPTVFPLSSIFPLLSALTDINTCVRTAKLGRQSHKNNIGPDPNYMLKRDINQFTPKKHAAVKRRDYAQYMTAARRKY